MHFDVPLSAQFIIEQNNIDLSCKKAPFFSSTSNLTDISLYFCYSFKSYNPLNLPFLTYVAILDCMKHQKQWEKQQRNVWNTQAQPNPHTAPETFENVGFISTVRPTVHTSPSQNCSKALFDLEKRNNHVIFLPEVSLATNPK